MQNLADLLSRFKEIENPKEIKIKVSSVFEKVFGFKVGDDSVKVSEGKLYVKVHPVQKNIIFMRKDDVLMAIRNDFPELTIKSIIFL
jgi:hypothetical protein